MSLDGPKPAYFWDEATNTWRKAVVGEAGEYVWNNTTNAWEFGTIGAEYKYELRPKCSRNSQWSKAEIGHARGWVHRDVREITN